MAARPVAEGPRAADLDDRGDRARLAAAFATRGAARLRVRLAVAVAAVRLLDVLRAAVLRVAMVRSFDDVGEFESNAE
ncbi:MAG: hypothetical protein ABI881_16310 [Betaproteobacteria bacterium]